MIVKKAYHMAKSMNVPILGIVENYSYLVCPDCGKKISVFGESHIEEIASKMDLKVLGKMPIDPSLAELSDKGDFAKAANQYLTDAFEDTASAGSCEKRRGVAFQGLSPTYE